MLRLRGAAAAAAAFLSAAGVDAGDPGCGTGKPGCQPWGKMTNGDGGGSCLKGEKLDLRFAYGDFDCGEGKNTACCGTNLYGSEWPVSDSTCISQIYTNCDIVTVGIGNNAMWWNASGGPTDVNGTMVSGSAAWVNMVQAAELSATDSSKYIEVDTIGVAPASVNAMVSTPKDGYGDIWIGANRGTAFLATGHTKELVFIGPDPNGTQPTWTATFIKVAFFEERNCTSPAGPCNCLSNKCILPNSCPCDAADMAEGWILQKASVGGSDAMFVQYDSAGCTDRRRGRRAHLSQGAGATPGPTCQCGNNYGSCPVGCVGYKTHIFCPPVDDFQQFSLKGSARVLSRSSRAGRSKSGDPKYNGQLDILVYGSGNSTPGETEINGERKAVAGSNIGIPYSWMHSRAVAWQFNHPDCDGKPAVASFLLYNVTLREGAVGYKNKQPIGNGFVPTCTDGKCNFGKNQVCLKKEDTGDQSNCGRCVEHWTPGMTPDATLDDYDINVMVTYYGSDNEGHTLTSGSMNPINFRQFSDADVYDDVYSTAKSKATGFKPPW